MEEKIIIKTDSLKSDMNSLRDNIRCSILEFMSKYDGFVIPQIEIIHGEKIISKGKKLRLLKVNVKSIIKS